MLMPSRQLATLIILYLSASLALKFLHWFSQLWIFLLLWVGWLMLFHCYLFYFWYCSLFFKQEMELSLIGLQNAGKTSLVNVIAVSKYSFEVFNLLSYVFFSCPFWLSCWWLNFLFLVDTRRLVDIVKIWSQQWVDFCRLSSASYFTREFTLPTTYLYFLISCNCSLSITVENFMCTSLLSTGRI